MILSPRRIAIITAVALFLAGCDAIASLAAGDRPAPPTFSSHVIDDAHYDVTIDYEYQGQVYHTAWNEHCFLYKDSFGRPAYMARARWRGEAAMLPDHSAVYFQMRSDICDNGQLNRLLFGPEGKNALWHGRHNDFEYDPTEYVINAADRDPAPFITPVVYWLNDAVHPKTVELCAVPACSTQQNSRVRFLGIHGAPSTSTTTSDPLETVPALATLTEGDQRFVGYTCWEIPFDEARQQMPNDLVGATLEDWATSPAGPNIAYQNMNILRHAGLPLMNAWASSGDLSATIGYSAYFPIGDWERAAPNLLKKAYVPITSWRKDCDRSSDIVQLGIRQALPTEPVVLKPASLRALSPTTFKLPNGKSLNAGQKYTDPDQAPPWTLSTEAVGDNRTLYIAEAIVFTVEYPKADR